MAGAGAESLTFNEISPSVKQLTGPSLATSARRYQSSCQRHSTRRESPFWRRQQRPWATLHAIDRFTNGEKKNLKQCYCSETESKHTKGKTKRKERTVIVIPDPNTQKVKTIQQNNNKKYKYKNKTKKAIYYDNTQHAIVRGSPPFSNYKTTLKQQLSGEKWDEKWERWFW